MTNHKKNQLKLINNKGFTLVEVIVVIVIIAILAAIAVPALTGYIDRAKERAAAAEGRNFMNAFSSAAVEIFAFGERVNGDQEGMLNWNAGSINTWHNITPSATPTVGFSMVAYPGGNSILTANALKEVSSYMSVDEATIKSSLECLIVKYDNTGAGKSDSVAGFVYKIKDNSWVAYNSKDANYAVFSSTADAVEYAKKCSSGF